MRIRKFFETHPWSGLIAIALVLNLVIECMSRRSILNTLLMLLSRPAVYFINASLVLAVISFGMLFRRRKFMVFLLSFLCFLAGFVDFVVRFMRKTPVTMEDIRVIDDGLRVAPKYIGKIGVILIFVVIAALLVGLVVVGWRSPKISGKIGYRGQILKILLCVITAILSIEVGLRVGILESSFGNLTEAFEAYGFMYCFGNSIVNRGISKPSEYSEDTIKELVEEVAVADETELAVLPAEERKEGVNVIFLQLESFMDPNLVEGVTYSRNPVPYFTYLKNHFPSGYLSVPCFGMGTVNSEFEILTGMNLDDFGAGEYPYKTFLLTTPCETTAYNWKQNGYATHVIHNNDGGFYGRQKVFPNMGFDDFTSIEYMNNIERNPVGWAKDKVLIPEIMEVLKSTEEKDFIYTISVQGHGDYPSEKEEDAQGITFTGFPFEEKENEWFYYINQINEMDDFLWKLTSQFNDFDENVVLVAYGDHLPFFPFEGEHLTSKDIYRSEYFIWSNFDLQNPDGSKISDKNMEAFELSAYVAGLLGNSNGLIAEYHQTSARDSESFLEGLKLLEYDYLYGDQEAVEKEDGIYQPVDMKMGHKNISVSNAYNFNQHFCVEGENFTNFSVVQVNGKEQETLCVSSYILVVQNVTLQSGDTITVEQKGSDRVSLSTTEEYVYYKN